MIPHNETSFREKVNPFCINCGSDNIVVFDYPFCKNAIFFFRSVVDLLKSANGSEIAA